MPSDQLNALLHFAQPEVFAEAGFAERSKRLEATAPVLYLQVDCRFLALKGQAYARCARVLAYVREGLQRNPVECGFDGGRKAF